MKHTKLAAFIVTIVAVAGLYQALRNHPEMPKAESVNTDSAPALKEKAKKLAAEITEDLKNIEDQIPPMDPRVAELNARLDHDQAITSEIEKLHQDHLSGRISAEEYIERRSQLFAEMRKD